LRFCFLNRHRERTAQGKESPENGLWEESNGSKPKPLLKGNKENDPKQNKKQIGTKWQQALFVGHFLCTSHQVRTTHYVVIYCSTHACERGLINAFCQFSSKIALVPMGMSVTAHVLHLFALSPTLQNCLLINLLEFKHLGKQGLILTPSDPQRYGNYI